MPFSQILRNKRDRRSFVGGSDARIIMGSDEAALIRLWREKRGEAEPEDLSGNLIVQLGLVTEALNRHWYTSATPGKPSNASSIGCGSRCCGGTSVTSMNSTRWLTTFVLDVAAFEVADPPRHRR